MKLAANFEKLLYTADGGAEITFSTAERSAAEGLRKLGETGLLSLEIKPHKEKRTIRANAYFWTLANAIANKLSVRNARPVGAEEVYKQYVRDFGKCQLVYFRNDAKIIKAFCGTWEQRGMGWMCFPQPTKDGDKYCEVQIFYGSSSYTREEMARLIDAVVADCKELGIETKTPDEIADMLSLMDESAPY